MRYLSIFTLLVASSSLASAAVISFSCSPVTNLGQSSPNPGGAVNCSGFSAPGGSSVIAISYQYGIDFSFDTFVAPTANITATINAPGANDVSVKFINTARPNTGTVNVAAVDFAAFIAGASLVTGHVGSAGVINSQFSARVNFTYEVDQTGGQIPEPSTLALVGGVLVLAGIRKFRS